MEHVVFYPAHDGTPAFRRVATLDDAVRLVEHLRNVELINEVSCHVLTEVPLAFRAYYRVEVPPAYEPSVPSQPAGTAPVEPAGALAELPAEPLADAPVAAEGRQPVLAAANGHASDGAKSLGFFA